MAGRPLLRMILLATDMDHNMLSFNTPSTLPVEQADDLPSSSRSHCPFLDMLPVEIRLMIYRHLLVARNVRRENELNSHDVCATDTLDELC